VIEQWALTVIQLLRFFCINLYWPTLLAWFRNWRCNNQASNTESNRCGQNQHCQLTSCTRSVLL